MASFANAAGGHILFGMEAKAGVPVKLSGVVIDNPDDEVLRLDTIIQSGITPKLPRVIVRAIPLGNGNNVVVIEIPRSWARPHMVSYRGTNRFYVRRSAGKDLMDVPEIRSAFVLSEAVTDKVRDFRSRRLADILSPWWRSGNALVCKTNIRGM